MIQFQWVVMININVVETSLEADHKEVFGSMFGTFLVLHKYRQILQV